MMAEENVAGTNLLAQAVKQLNETDAKGAVGQIKSFIVLIQSNDKKIAAIQKHSQELLKEVTKLTAAGGLSAERFAGES
jgi:hypothetical protein